ncbi:MAG TPA: hypothetical protein VGP79_19140 [Bryobacteraceae bacterium]|nr:hypothetical protein [Bryobacteraceae bacterium]
MKFWISALLVIPAMLGDDWPAPQIREVFSQSREFFVRVNPGSSIGDTVGFGNSPKGPYANAEFYRRQPDRSYRLTATVLLQNPVAPVEFFVTNGGMLITLDNWHNNGYGKVVVFYGPNGDPIRSYTLADLFSPDEIRAFSHSVSSIAWRQSLKAYVRSGDETFYITGNQPGAGFVFEVNSGAYQYCEHRAENFLCRDSNTNRKWKAYREPAAK